MNSKDNNELPHFKNDIRNYHISPILGGCLTPSNYKIVPVKYKG